MGDLSTLVLETTIRTTTQPALIAFNARREAARVERERVRVERIHRARALDLAAAQSQTRPVKSVRVATPKAPRVVTPKVSRVRVPGESKPRVYTLKIVPCTNCGQMTRPANVTADRAPNTVTRRRGLCVDCAPPRTTRIRTTTNRPPQLRMCAGTCGRMTRPAKMSKSDAPDTVPRKVHGKCSTCLSGGLKPRQPKVDPQLLTDAYLSGLSMRQVADKYGIAQSTVKRHIGRLVTIRPPKPAKPKPEPVDKPNPIRLCEGTCGRLTRPRNSTPAHIATGAIARVKDGKCSTCLTGGDKRESRINPAVIVAEYQAGDSLQRLADRYGIARTTVVYHLNRAGVARRAATMHNGGNP